VDEGERRGRRWSVALHEGCVIRPPRGLSVGAGRGLVRLVLGWAGSGGAPGCCCCVGAAWRVTSACVRVLLGG